MESSNGATIGPELEQDVLAYGLRHSWLRLLLQD